MIEMIDLEELLKIPYVDSEHPPAVSPDGKRIAYSSNLSGEWEIYILPLQDPKQTRQISQGEGGKFAPLWSADRQWLYFALDRDGSERFDIYRYSMETEELQNLTPDTPESIEPEFDLSPSGDRLALISDRTGLFEVYLLDLKSSEWHKASQLPYPACDVKWSPDGKFLAITVTSKGQDYYSYLLNLEDGSVLEIGDTHGPICARQVAWSPDGSMLAFASDLKGFYNIGIYDLNLRRYAWLTSGKGDKEAPRWSPDGRKIAFLLGQGAKNSLAVMDLKLRETAVCQHEAGIYARPSFAPDSKTIFFVFENPRNPPNLFQFTLPDGKPTVLTHSPGLESIQERLIMPQEIFYRSFDGKDVPAVLFKPASVNDPTPAIVYVHGGPNWLTQICWDGLIQHMASRGWVVIAPNYRGSTGYGRDWQLLNRYDLGGEETKDVSAAVDYLLQSQLANPERIGVTGRSHGGYLTMTCLTQFPERWACGSAVVPFLNWFTAHANARQDLQHWDLENFGDPELDKERYYARSPYFFLDRIQAPVQLICGENDPRCPASESTQAYQRLKELGKESEIYLYEGEGHLFLKRKNVIDSKKKQIGFLARYLES